jgi:ankyrin repeat protein
MILYFSSFRFWTGKTLILMILTGILGFAVLNPAKAADPKDFWFYIINDRDQQLRDLLRKGMDPNRKSPNQQTPLTLAARENSWKAFDVLLASPKIDVNLPNLHNETPLMYTALLGDLPRTQQILSKGAKVNQPGWSALHYAAIKGHAKIVSLLISKGASVNEHSLDGDTPLILAVRSGDVDTVQALIKAGADPLLSNFKAQNAIETARSEGRRSLATSLEKIAESRKAQN